MIVREVSTSRCLRRSRSRRWTRQIGRVTWLKLSTACGSTYLELCCPCICLIRLSLYSSHVNCFSIFQRSWRRCEKWKLSIDACLRHVVIACSNRILQSFTRRCWRCAILITIRLPMALIISPFCFRRGTQTRKALYHKAIARISTTQWKI